MTTKTNCTCQKTDCGTCGPTGTGCVCTKGKCECKDCINAPHSVKCDCRGAGDNCECTKQGQACTCEAKPE